MANCVLNEIMGYNYLDIINKKGINNIEGIIASIDKADLELLRAILTYYVR